MQRITATFFSALLLGYAGYATANGFQYGFSLQQNSVSTDTYNYSVSAISGYYYLQEVKTNGIPIGEAAFLNRVPRLDGGIELSDLTSNVYYNEDSIGYEAAYTHASPASPMTWLISLKTRNTDYSNSSGSTVGDMAYLKYRLGVGWFVANNTHLQAIYSREDYTATGVTASYDYGNTYDLSAKHVILLGRGSALVLNAGYAFTDYSTNTGKNIVSGGFDYYPRLDLSIGGDFDVTSGDLTSSNGSDLLLRAISYPSRNLALGIEYRKFTPDDATAEVVEETRLITDFRY
ncbi:MAG: hypothetical protein OEZ39_06325 [Gammaproteobacteria bacterium]|nr:hypothetical protein [Gammaproteobacteria bacterium]MDH5651472.1 hypothetical protein [Gammaproteobacteria bacterium]